MILHAAGPYPGLMKVTADPGVEFLEFDTKSGAAFGHATAAGALAVGAVDYTKTPAFGVSLPRIEGFSSAGGSPLLFSAGGIRLATPTIRQQPAITAPNGANTTFFVDGRADLRELVGLDTELSQRTRKRTGHAVLQRSQQPFLNLPLFSASHRDRGL